MELHPIGIMPKNIWIAYRIEEIKQTIKRFEDTNLPVPTEWYDELKEHLNSLNK